MKYFRLQPEYRGKRWLKVNVSMQLNGEVLIAYLSSYGGVEDFTLITSAHCTAYGDYTFTMILDRGGFNAIPHMILYQDTITVIVEGRKPLCWHCKQLCHFSRSCLQKTIINKAIAATATTDTTITTTTATTTTTTKTIDLNTETTDHANKEGWTLVKGKKKKNTRNWNKKYRNSNKPDAFKKKKMRKNQTEEMETATNLKRRRDSGDAEKEGEKKQFKTNSPKPEKQKPQPKMSLQPQQPAPQRPAQNILPQWPEQNIQPQQPAQNILPLNNQKIHQVNNRKSPSPQHYLLSRLFQPQTIHPVSFRNKNTVTINIPKKTNKVRIKWFTTSPQWFLFLLGPTQIIELRPSTQKSSQTTIIFKNHGK